MKSICIIPARGGSKRIPRKNIKEFLGKPLIAYSLNSARESRVFDKILVSTDDKEIADTALNFGADDIIWRDHRLSDDFATTADVMEHAIESLQQEIQSQQAIVCCLYATAPLLKSEYLVSAKQALLDFPKLH